MPNPTENREHCSVDHQVLKKQYDQRYDGSYMDADSYTTWVHEGLAAHRVKQTLQQIPGKPARILDYGCGQGKWTLLLLELFPEAEIVGIDISGVATEKAARKYLHCRFMAFDGVRAPLEDSSFDLIFSFHVLEHVLDICSTIEDIARLLRPGGHACIIFPCGNRHSFEDRFVGLLRNGRERSPTGEEIFFFEKEEGHLRRIDSAQTITYFKKEGLELLQEFYSGQFFAALDWLVRGTGPHYINGMFRGVVPVSTYASLKLLLMHQLLLRLNRFLGFKNLDLTKPRSIFKQPLVRLAARTSSLVDSWIKTQARREWDLRRDDKRGSVQYLIFQKTS
jgi:ubiquinone/menaquinone biosynthesis C-methylase UbiE